MDFKAVNEDRAVVSCVLAREMSVLADKQGGMDANARDCFPRIANLLDDSRLWNVQSRHGGRNKHERRSFTLHIPPLCLTVFPSTSQTKRLMKSACDTESSNECPMLCKRTQLCAISLTGCVKRDWCNPIVIPSLITIQLVFLFWVINFPICTLPIAL